jgi:putative spermidine/putrescine transport system substrate-binding protein
MTIKINRRMMMAGGAAAMALGSRRAVAEERLVLGTFGGDYGDALQTYIDKPFFTSKGVDVQRDIATQDPRKAKLIAERASRRGTIDVAMLSSVDTYTLSLLQIWEQVSEENVPKVSRVLKNLRSPFSIPHIVTGMVILYNPDKVKPAPKSFADMWDPKYRGRVGLSDIVPLYNFAVAALAFGGSMTNFDPGKSKLMELKSLGVRIYSSNEALATALKSEEIWMTPMYVSRGYQWRHDGVPVAKVVPTEGAILYISSAAVPKNAPNKAVGIRYLNAMLDPEIQVAFSKTMGYAPTVDNAILPPDLASEVGFTIEEQARANLPDYDYFAKNTAHLMDWWNRDFKG